MTTTVLNSATAQLAGKRNFAGMISESGISFIFLMLDLTKRSACKKATQATVYLVKKELKPLNKSFIKLTFDEKYVLKFALE